MTNKSHKTKKDDGYRVIRLVNGERLIAKVSGSNTTKLFLERPMSINGIISTESVNPLYLIKKEFLVLNNWMEFCQNNVVGIPRNLILTISDPDEFIKDAYNTQKECEDTGNRTYMSYGNNDDDEEDNDFTNIINHINTDINHIINEIISGNMMSYSEEEWSDDDIDKSRKNYGNDMDDWSPYLDDYFDNL